MCLFVAVGVSLAVGVVVAGTSTSRVAAPGDPVVVRGADGVYAAAVPGFVGAPAISGEAVAFTIEDEARDRLFSIGKASSDSALRTLYRPPVKRPGSATFLAASPSRVVALRDQPDIETCVVNGDCTPSPGELIGGGTDGDLSRLFGATERLDPKGSCRRRIAQLGDAGGSDEVSLSGDRIAYARRVRCLSPRRPGRPQIVVRNLQTGAGRVVYRGVAVGVQLAGRFLAFETYGRRNQGIAVVLDLPSGRVAYRARAGDWWSLGDDGKLATATFAECCSLVGTLGWYSPESPRLHRLPNRVSVFSSSPLIYAEGRIAYVRGQNARDAQLAVTDLRGRARVHARFRAPEELEAFDFDGTQLAFAHTRYRADRGAADDGIRSICVEDRILVQASATVVEVHPVTDRGRIPTARLPAAAPHRSPAAERPDCPYRD